MEGGSTACCADLPRRNSSSRIVTIPDNIRCHPIILTPTQLKHFDNSFQDCFLQLSNSLYMFVKSQLLFWVYSYPVAVQ